MTLPGPIADWFASRGWQPRAHQMAMLAAARAGSHALLIAPTGAGKTLAGFLPALADSIERPGNGLTTLYVSPLKALGVDIARNLATPVAEMGLALRIETRSGDTPGDRKARQRQTPPDILITTPESLSLLLSYADAPTLFAGLRSIIIDEVHAFASSKRGDLLSLAMARLQKINPALRRVALSATVADADGYRRWLAPHADAGSVTLVQGAPGAAPVIDILVAEDRIPWAGHAGRHAVPQVLDLIRAHRMTLVFVNTRSIAERIFQDLWSINSDTLPIGLHHGSLAVEQRRKVEKAMADGRLRAIVATASLDLGIDWGDIDLVIQMGAPKGSSRMLQRIGRANHRLDVPSRAVIVPGNRFEYLEAVAARDAVLEGVRDDDGFRPGTLDVLAQHLTGLAAGGGFRRDEMLAEVRSATPYAQLSDNDFTATLGFAEDGGYALRAYDRFKKLRLDTDGVYRLSHPRLALQYRLNAGTIVETPMLDVRQTNFRKLGKVEENFIEAMVPGDTFLLAGELLEFVRIEDNAVIVKPGKGKTPRIPSYAGGRLPLTTHLADRVRHFLAEPESWPRFPEQVQEWLRMQRAFSQLPDPAGLLVETFPRDGLHYLVAYAFEGFNAHQSLGLLLTRRMESAGFAPMGYVASDYVLAAWSLKPVEDPAPLFSPDILEAEFHHWMEQSAVVRRAFRDVAVISGLIERQHPGKKKSGRQVLYSTDLIFDVLRKYEPTHVLMRASWADARARVTDLGRLGAFLQRVQGRITHQPLERVSPLAVPAILSIGCHGVQGSAEELLVAEAAGLIEEAMHARGP